MPTGWVHTRRRKFMYFVWVPSRPSNYRHKLLSFWLSFVLHQSSRPWTEVWNQLSRTYARTLETRWSTLCAPISKVDGKGTERASLLSFGLRIRIGPTSKLHNPLAIFTINIEGKTLIYKRASKIYSPQGKTFSNLVPLDRRANRD